jgi:hypothetical protein
MKSNTEDWLQAYSQYWDAAPKGPFVPCPECDAPTLGLVFGTTPTATTGVAFFWCDTCRNGIAVSRATVKVGVETIALSASNEERAKRIPEYRIVQT